MMQTAGYVKPYKHYVNKSNFILIATVTRDRNLDPSSVSQAIAPLCF